MHHLLNKTPRWAALAVTALLLAVTAACGGGDGGEGEASGTPTGEASGTPTDAGEVGEVHFVVSTGLTGQSAFFGKGAWLATQLLRDQVNEAGGLTDNCGNTYMVKLTVFDDADDPETTVAGFQKAAADETVLGVIGSDSDVAWLPQLPLAGSLKMPLIIPSDGSEIEEENWNPYAFRVFGSASTTFRVATQKLKDAIGFSRVAVLYDISQDAQTAEAELWRQFASELGYEVVAFESFRRDDTDFRPQLTNIEAANPDLLVLNRSEPSGLYRQARELGLIPGIPAYSAYGENATEEVWDLSGGASEGAYFTSPTAIGQNIEQHDSTPLELYEEAEGVLPHTFQIVAWDGLNVALDAVKRACTATDREKFRDALAETKDFPLASQGTITWENPPTGENITPSAIVGRITGKAEFEVVE